MGGIFKKIPALCTAFFLQAQGKRRQGTLQEPLCPKSKEGVGGLVGSGAENFFSPLLEFFCIALSLTALRTGRNRHGVALIKAISRDKQGSAGLSESGAVGHTPIRAGALPVEGESEEASASLWMKLGLPKPCSGEPGLPQLSTPNKPCTPWEKPKRRDSVGISRWIRPREVWGHCNHNASYKMGLVLAGRWWGM